MKEYINTKQFEGKKISILGCGKSGLEAALALKKCKAEVFVSEMAIISEEYKRVLEENKIPYEENGHTKKVLHSDLIVVSPGVKLSHPIIQQAIDKNIEILGELEIGYQLTSGKYIAITGTNGKSTVTELTYMLLKENLPGENVIMAGNVGEPLSMFALQRGIFVLEVSSFQLKTIKDFRPDLATILNIDQDHLDWHPDFEDYVRSKAKIYENQENEDFILLNYDDPVVRKLSSEPKSKVLMVSLEKEFEEGIYYNPINKEVILKINDNKITLFTLDDLKLPGLHNIFNAAVSATFAFLLGIEPEKIRKTLSNFKGLPHRIEFVLEKNGVKFFDDSKGTNPHAVEWALRCFKEPIILILGGEDKDLDFKPLMNSIKEHCKCIIAIGKAKPKIIRTFSGELPVYEAMDMKDAVEISYNLAKPGDVVLLSPGCASFDMFKNYKERGDVFQHWVREIAKEH